FAMEKGVFPQEREKAIDGIAHGGLLLATSAEQIEGDSIETIEVSLLPRGKGEALPDGEPFEGFSFYLMKSQETGSFATIEDLLLGLGVVATIEVFARRYNASDADYSMEQITNEVIESIQAETSKLAIPSFTAHPISNADFPIDKINSNVWKLLEDATPGQYGFDLGGNFVAVDETTGFIDVDYNMASQKDKAISRNVPVTYCIDFSGLEDSITKKLEPYDKRVCIAVAALFNAGYEVMTLQQIYNAMGKSGGAGKSVKKKINDALTKLKGANLHLDNTQEADTHNRITFKYDGSVVPMERVQAIVNGNLAESAVHVFREPPLISFARERKQITTVPIRLFDSPLSNTSANIRLEDYLMERIARIKKDGSKTSNKILFATIYKNTGIKTKKQKQRAPEKIERLLDHYKDCGFITGYSIEHDGVKIFY
ncbi:MAG: hypothetical protein IJ087_11055, partial [Eggerthellaceae bacterium]|nr:hypothetical protein [Eggerthellaceae bacterium]